MRNCLYITLFLASIICTESNAQSRFFIVKNASFSSRISNEFSPVYYNDGIVFCSDRSDNSIVAYRDGISRLFKIFYTRKKISSGWEIPRILSKEITSGFNDGPVTFNEKMNIIYYSRNNSIKNSMRNIADTSNKLGIYSAELIGGIWTNIKPFKYNDPRYSFGTPSLSPDGERIYFASDMPGGLGGMDLYYCDRRDSDWVQPVNLGPVINTPKNESFPFAAKYGKLFFASDGHNGFGGKDLYYTSEVNGVWISPVHLDSAINSSADDFGIVTDSTFENGYFSTNRLKTDDIFTFRSAPVEFPDCDTIRKNKYCYIFYDDKYRAVDSVPMIYNWDFGDGKINMGKEVNHCFPGPGKFKVSLTIIDKLTGKEITKQVEYDVDLKNFNQALIKSDDIGSTDKPVSFEGISTDLKGLNITDYFRDFGDGFKPGSQFMNKTFKNKGEYQIRLGLLAREDSTGSAFRTCVIKKIKIR